MTVRFGDTLQIFKDLKKGDRTKRFWSNRTYGKGFTRVVLPTDDTITYFPINQKGQKVFYNKKLLVKVKIIESVYTHKDTLEIKYRRRFIF